MNKYLSLIIISLLLCTNVYAKWNYNVGDIVQNEVVFGKKDAFKLPPGKFIVAVISREKEFRDIMLYQIDKDSGYARWAIQFYATGRTQWEYWNPPKFCKRTNVYFIKEYKGNNSYACWMVNHSRSDIGANKGFWSKVREYEIANKIKTPDIFVYSRYEYSKGSKMWGSSYYYNPELDGIPKPKSLEWDTNEFHKQRVMNYPKHEEFLKKYISVTSTFISEFNKTHKIKNSSKLSLNVEQNFTQASINTGEGTSNQKKKKLESSIVEELKSLKDLLDSGAITQDEFEKAKKKILN